MYIVNEDEINIFKITEEQTGNFNTSDTTSTLGLSFLVESQGFEWTARPTSLVITGGVVSNTCPRWSSTDINRGKGYPNMHWNDVSSMEE